MRHHFYPGETHIHGLGDAVLPTKAFVGNEPLSLCLVMTMGIDEKAVPHQTTHGWRAYPRLYYHVTSPSLTVSAYGVIAHKARRTLYSVETFVEKPAPEDVPEPSLSSDTYALPPKESSEEPSSRCRKWNSADPDAIDTLNKTQRVFARVQEARWCRETSLAFWKLHRLQLSKHPI